MMSKKHNISQNPKTLNVTKPKNSKCDKTQKYKMWQFKNLNLTKLKTSKCDDRKKKLKVWQYSTTQNFTTQKFNMWQKERTQNMTTQKLKMWQNLKTKNVTKL